MHQPSGKKIFDGASEISMTRKKISVTRKKIINENGKYSEIKSRKYHDKSPENMRAFFDAMNQTEVKKVTVKLK